jgi:protein involved in polysaccharide export with SLBB domain
MLMRHLTLALVALSGVAGALPAQQSTGEVDPRRVYLVRDDLESLLGFYERSAESTAYSDRLRQRAVDEASLVRTRLDAGDFQVGDRVVLTVAGEEALTDTFTVAQGRKLEFGELGEVELRGVLRSELRTHLDQHLRRYLRDPNVRAQSLVRVSVEGAVGNPGFYVIPSETPLADVVMRAGGPASNARVQDLRILRGERRLLSGDDARVALAEGATLDQLNLRAGDRITVPAQTSLGGFERPLRSVALLLALPASIFGLIAIFR